MRRDNTIVQEPEAAAAAETTAKTKTATVNSKSPFFQFKSCMTRQSKMIAFINREVTHIQYTRNWWNCMWCDIFVVADSVLQLFCFPSCSPLSFSLFLSLSALSCLCSFVSLSILVLIYRSHSFHFGSFILYLLRYILHLCQAGISIQFRPLPFSYSSSACGVYVYVCVCVSKFLGHCRIHKTSSMAMTWFATFGIIVNKTAVAAAVTTNGNIEQ